MAIALPNVDRDARGAPIIAPFKTIEICAEFLVPALASRLKECIINTRGEAIRSTPGEVSAAAVSLAPVTACAGTKTELQFALAAATETNAGTS